MVIEIEKLTALETRLTELKKWSMLEADPFGMSKYDCEIKAIFQTLEIFGASFQYDENLVAHIYFK